MSPTLSDYYGRLEHIADRYRQIRDQLSQPRTIPRDRRAALEEEGNALVLEHAVFTKLIDSEEK